MPNTPRIPIPYPDHNSNPWDDQFKAMVLAIDATAYCPREDRNIIIFGGGTMSFSAGTGVLSWTGEIDLFASVTGHLWGIAPGSVTLQDGQIFYITISRAPQNNAIYAPIVGFTTPNEPDGDDQLLIGLRKGSVVHFRNGMVILSGQSQNIFDSNGFSGGSHPRRVLDSFILQEAFKMRLREPSTLPPAMSPEFYPGPTEAVFRALPM
jgi:hypothetical protein